MPSRSSRNLTDGIPASLRQVYYGHYSGGYGIGASSTAANERPTSRRFTLQVAKGFPIVPLVAGLLVVVAALEGAGITQLTRAALDAATALPPWLGREVVGFATAGVANAANNLPVAAFAARALAATPHSALSHAVVVGIDLGPNLSLSGSLATVLWLVILRREGIEVTPWQFITRGTVVLLPALLAALVLAR